MPRHRTKIRSYDVMPAILELLKKEERLKTKVITERMQAVANAKALPFRRRAVGHSLTALEFKGWISHEARGVWSITTDGLKRPKLSEAEAIEIGKEYEAHNIASTLPKVLFARVGWMKYYNGSQPGDERPLGGGGYNSVGRVSEICNFKVVNGDQLYGFYEAPGRDALDRGVTNLDRIVPGTKHDRLSGVLVVFIAPDPSGTVGTSHLKVIGWYRDAEVLRVWADDRTGQRSTIGATGHAERALYNAKANANSAVLLPLSRRVQCIPRGDDGMGQANVRYMYDGDGFPALTPWMREVLNYIETYRAENLLQEQLADVSTVAEDELENAAGFETNPRIRQIVEKYAMSFVEREYVKNGFDVANHSKTESYDLLCTKDGAAIRVEVKGTRTDGTAIIITENEVKLTCDPEIRVDLCIVHSIDLRGDTASGGVLERYDNWNPAKHELRPISYQCRLSRGTGAKV